MSREHTVLFAGRHEPRKGLQVLLRAWPEIHRRTGARLRVCGADPLAVRLLLTRLRVPDDGIDVLGFLTQEDLTRELTRTKALIAPSLGGESFGMVLTRAFACALPVVASDIPGLPRRDHPRDRGDGRTRRPGGAGGRGHGAARGRTAAGGDGRRGAGRSRSRSTRGTTSRPASSASTSRRSDAAGGCRMKRVLYSRWFRVAVVVLTVRLGARSRLWWRGPEWGTRLPRVRLRRLALDRRRRSASTSSPCCSARSRGA